MKLKRVTSEILWVRDGVAVHRETFEIDGCIGLKVLVSAQGFKTDLSGLRLIKSENLLSRRAELQKSLVARLDEFWHQTRGEGVDVTHRERNVNTTILGVAGTVASAWLLPPAFLAAAPTALALAAWSHYRTKVVAARLDTTLDRELELLASRAEGALAELPWNRAVW